MFQMQERDDRLQPSMPAELGQTLDATYNLALFGAEALGCGMCASAFLNHAFDLAAHAEARRRFVECLLLLGMTNLLARLLRATDGVDLAASTVARDGGERLVLRLSNGEALEAVLPGPGAGRDERAAFAASLSRAVLHAAARAVQPSPTPLPAIAPDRARPLRDLALQHAG